MLVHGYVCVRESTVAEEDQKRAWGPLELQEHVIKIQYALQ